jgi:hypothetical protein
MQPRGQIMNSEQQRQIKIDADIDEVIKTIQGLGLKCDEKTIPTNDCRENPSSGGNRWVRFAAWIITAFTAGAFTGFLGAHNLHPSNNAGEASGNRSPEIRRAIPVEPEIRRAISVEPEIRKAISVRSKSHH